MGDPGDTPHTTRAVLTRAVSRQDGLHKVWSNPATLRIRHLANSIFIFWQFLTQSKVTLAKSRLALADSCVRYGCASTEWIGHGVFSGDAIGGGKKRRVENLTNDTPPKKGFWTPPHTVRFPPRSGVSALFFPVQKIEAQRRPEARLLGGVQKFSGERVLWYVFLPPYVLHPAISRPNFRPGKFKSMKNGCSLGCAKESSVRVWPVCACYEKTPENQAPGIPKHLLRPFLASNFFFSKVIFKNARNIPFKTRLAITF